MTTQELVALALALPDMDGVPTQTPYYALLNKLVRFVRPIMVVELGTGQGYSAVAMLLGMGKGAPHMLVTVNLPKEIAGEDMGVALTEYRRDSRLYRIREDSRRVNTDIFGNIIEFLFIDSDHTYECISEEWRLYSPLLTNDAVVCVDDIDFPGGGVRKWWEEQACDKVVLPEMSPYGFGVLQFRRDA